MATLNYANQNAIRNEALDPKLERILADVGSKLGVNFEVVSGGQPSEGPNRTGSHRHDEGGAADIKMFTVDQNGQRVYISSETSSGRDLWSKAIQSAVAQGAKGVGMATDYMGNYTAHIGFGTPVAWGSGGKSANAPSWVKQAWSAGMSGAQPNYSAPTPSPAPMPAAVASAYAGAQPALTAAMSLSGNSPISMANVVNMAQPQQAFSADNNPSLLDLSGGTVTGNALNAVNHMAQGGNPQPIQQNYETVTTTEPPTKYRLNLDNVLNYARESGQLTGLPAMLPNNALYGSAQDEIAKQMPKGATYDRASNTITVSDTSLLTNPPIDPATGKPADFANYIAQGLAQPINQGKTTTEQRPVPTPAPALNRNLQQPKQDVVQGTFQVLANTPASQGAIDAANALHNVTAIKPNYQQVIDKTFQTIDAQQPTQGQLDLAQALAAKTGNTAYIGNTPVAGNQPQQPQQTTRQVQQPSASVRALQTALQAQGFDPGGADGLWGPNTEAAVRQFQEAAGIKVDGIAGSQTLGALRTYGSTPAVSAPATSTASSSSGGSDWRSQAASVYNNLRSQDSTSSRNDNEVRNAAGAVATGRMTENQARSLLYSGAPF